MTSDGGTAGRGKWFLVRKTGSTSLRLGLEESERTVVGRQDSGICIQSPTVEARHALLSFDPDTAHFVLQDLETQSGTFVNGKKVSCGHALQLSHKDLIRFGFDSDLYEIRLEAERRKASGGEGQSEEMDSEARGLRQEPKPRLPPSTRLHQKENASVRPSTFHVDGCDSGHGSSPSPSSPTKVTSPARTKERTPTLGSGSAEGLCSPMAFTVDFGGPQPKGPFAISDSLSQFAPRRHRRNLSLSRPEPRPMSEGQERPWSESGEGAVREGRPPQEPLRSLPPTTPPHRHPAREDGGGRGEEDGQSATGTYTLELEGKDASSGTSRPHTPTHSSLEWVRQWAETAAQHINTTHQEGNGSESETQFLLHDTRRETGLVVMTMSVEESASQRLRPSNPPTRQAPEPRSSCAGESGSRRPLRQLPSPSKEALRRATSALPHATHKGLSLEGSATERRTKQSHIPQFAAEARSGLGRSEEARGARGDAKAPLRPSPPPARTPSPFARNDGGRFSLRTATTSAPTQSPLARPKSRGGLQRPRPSSRSPPPMPLPPPRKEGQGRGRGRALLATAHRSASSLTAKEVELANWNRRRTYDPLKAAAAGKKKPPVPKEADEEPGLRINPDGAASVSKSPSCRGLASSAEELLSDGAGEDEPREAASPWRLGSGSLQRVLHGHAARADAPSDAPLRHRHKFEALDSLVIATIHSLSNKVRTAARQLLQKIHLEQSDDENGALVEEMICQLKELEGASPNRGPSRELSGTLRNLKKLEQVILVLDRILCGEGEDS